ncbi:hypothetical protein AUEXF2481DRAFT_220863 [Aureobasidium subglaciale EXF-2481]|uniref:Uncharacterized protein n=1 Tax=Aureobasidium subglaciale (strain EXF-2481) TaxID=1043005 RepID=A0A074Z9L3_AURSE|nr:uncharacterized protein AUEXF2481DRAFT_220863 [Aureobasidium subglaciale EXF-2481]KEQ95491.1 hypothetical protein AUEXF2481DRAFT_220863 [Aureobasidium subglaciale EXF-2481]
MVLMDAATGVERRLFFAIVLATSAWRLEPRGLQQTVPSSAIIPCYQNVECWGPDEALFVYNFLCDSSIRQSIRSSVPIQRLGFVVSSRHGRAISSRRVPLSPTIPVCTSPTSSGCRF